MYSTKKFEVQKFDELKPEIELFAKYYLGSKKIFLPMVMHLYFQQITLKAHEVGVENSIMIINGLGGRNYSIQHAINSAIIINQINPKYLSTLILSSPFGKEHFMGNDAKITN